MAPRHLYTDTGQDDEVDLVLIVTQIIHFFNRNLKVFFLFITIGLLAGTTAFFLLPKVYKVSMLADSRILKGEEVAAVVDSWLVLIKKNEHNLLAKKLNISSEDAANIKYIEAEESKKVYADKARSAFLIKLELFDNSSLDSVQSGIIYGLKNSSYIRRRVETQRENLELLKDKISNEIEELNSVKLALRNLLKSGSNNSNPFLTDPGTINLQIVSLYERNLQIAENLKFIDEIQIIEGFTKYSKPDSPKLIICLIGGLAVGIMLAFIYILLKKIQANLQAIPAE
jgi:hypothetical protein